jgi:hypothetical protein
MAKQQIMRLFSTQSVREARGKQKENDVENDILIYLLCLNTTLSVEGDDNM